MDINDLLESQKNKKVLSALDYVQLLDLIKYMYPFREGNGRSTRLFLQCYATNRQQIIDYPVKDAQEGILHVCRGDL